MKILLLSNQGMVPPFVGNPIMLRYRDALLQDKRIDEVQMLRCKHPFAVRKQLRLLAKEVDLIHIHFGGMYALATWFLLIGVNKPKFITFHGTDIHAKAIKTAKSVSAKIRIKLNQYSSFASILLFSKCGFVAREMLDYVPSMLTRKLQKRFFIQRLGVDYGKFSMLDKKDCQDKLSLKQGHYFLFSDVANGRLKRRDIASAILSRLPGYELLIMCGVKADEVPIYINASDALILTSDQEGSPNIIREALSLNKPVFSVDVGDAAKQLEGLNNSSIIPRNPDEAAAIIKEKLNKPYTDNTRETKRVTLDFSKCSENVIKLYTESIKH